MESIGTYLRRRREERNMSVGELSRATRIPAATLCRIESDQFDDLPGEVESAVDAAHPELEPRGQRVDQHLCSDPRSRLGAQRRVTWGRLE